MEDIKPQSNQTPTPLPSTTPEAPIAASPAPDPMLATSPAPVNPVTDSPKVDAPESVKGSKKKLGSVLVILVLLLAIPVAAYAGNKMSSQKIDKAEKTAAEFKSQVALLQAGLHEIPEGAVKVTECIPNMGLHYLAKGGDKEFGPFLLVNKQEKVIGTEYMFDSTMFSAIPKTDPPVEVVTKDSPMYGWKYDHIGISHMSKGHPGLSRDHTDVHMYTVTKDEQKNACK